MAQSINNSNSQHITTAYRANPIFDYFLRLNCVDSRRKRIRIPLGFPTMYTGMPQDYILKSLRSAVQGFRVKSFDNFSIQVHVSPTIAAFAFHDIKDRWIGFNEYEFEVFGGEKKHMRVTVDAKWNVKIWYLGRWKPVTAYFERIRPVKDEWHDSMTRTDFMHQNWRQQADWWTQNGKVFPLMGLPAEIREVVYEHLWGLYVEPYPTSRHRKLTEVGKYAARLRMPNVHLLRASKEVGEEASNTLFLRTHFLLQHHSILQTLTTNVDQRIRIRNLTLAFSHHDFMRLFSATHERKDRKTKTKTIGHGYPALALRSMKLNHLRLVFAPPSVTTKTGEFDGACQRVAVEKIMDAAWPITRGHPVSTHGYIKDEQQALYAARDLLERKRVQAWQQRRAQWGVPQGTLADYDEERDDEVGGVPVDGSRPEIEPEEYSAPTYDLTCRCDPPCTEDTWIW